MCLFSFKGVNIICYATFFLKKKRTLVGTEFSWHWLKSVTLKGGEEMMKKVAKTDIVGNYATKNMIYISP